MDISAAGFDWDNGNREHCQKHGVSVAEIEALFMESRLVIRPDLAHSQTEERFLGIGKTAAGRTVFLAFTVRRLISWKPPHSPPQRPIHAPEGDREL